MNDVTHKRFGLVNTGQSGLQANTIRSGKQ